MGILGHSYHKTAYVKSDIYSIALKDISYPYFICYSKQAYWCVAYDEIASSKRTLYVVVAALGGGADESKTLDIYNTLIEKSN